MFKIQRRIFSECTPKALALAALFIETNSVSIFVSMFITFTGKPFLPVFANDNFSRVCLET